MKVEIIHPEEQSIEIINQSIINGDPIRRSPHVGNLNNQELSLILGLASLGGTVDLELVDTINGLDNYSNPKYLITSKNQHSLMSNKHAKNRVVGKCIVNNATDDLMISGNKVVNGISVQDLHLSAIEKVMPENVKVNLSSVLFASIGDSILEEVVRHSSRIIDRLPRKVLECGKIVAVEEIETDNIFGLGDNPLSGMLPPLEAMMAIELIIASINSQGKDQRIVHVAGPSMIQYTKDPNIMDPAINICETITNKFGIANNILIEYIIPCMSHLLNSPKSNIKMLSNNITSQYDMLGLAE